MPPLLTLPVLQSPELVLQMPGEDKPRGLGLGVICRVDMVAVRCKA